jgi:hypothetical protein
MITYVRYLDYFLLGIISSKKVLFFVEKKISSFIRSHLALDLKILNVCFSSDSPVLFLGFHIRLSRTSFVAKSFSGLKNNKNYLRRLFSRNEVYQKRVYLQSVSRINSEIISCFLSLLRQLRIAKTTLLTV